MPAGGQPYLPNPERQGEFLVLMDDGSVMPVDAELASALASEFPQERQEPLFAQRPIVPLPDVATDATTPPAAAPRRVGGIFGEGGLLDQVPPDVQDFASSVIGGPFAGERPAIDPRAAGGVAAIPGISDVVFGTEQAPPTATPAPGPVQEGPPTVLDQARSEPMAQLQGTQEPQVPVTLENAFGTRNLFIQGLDISAREDGYMLDREALQRGVLSLIPDPSFRTGGGVSGALRARATTAEEAFNSALQRMLGDIDAGGKMKAAEAEGAANILEGLDRDLFAQEEEAQQNERVRQQEIDRELDELGQRMDFFSSLRVEPNRIFATSGGAAGVAAAVNVAAGMLASAITNGLAPGTDLPNTALQILETAVDNDIRAQLANADIASRSVQDQNSLLGFMMGRMEDSRGVEDGLRAVLLQRASNMLEQHMLRMQSPQVRNQAQLVIDRINLDIAAAQQQALQAAMRRAGRGRRRELSAGTRQMLGQAADRDLNIHRYAGGEPQRPGSIQERAQHFANYTRRGQALPGGYVVVDEQAAQAAVVRESGTSGGVEALNAQMRRGTEFASTYRGMTDLLNLVDNPQYASPSWRTQVTSALAQVRMDVVGNLFNQGALQAQDYERAQETLPNPANFYGMLGLGVRESLERVRNSVAQRLQDHAIPGTVHQELLPGPGRSGRGGQRPSTLVEE